MPEEVLLRLKNEVGQSFQTTTSMQTRMQGSGDGKGGGPTRETMFVEMVQEHRCTEVKDGSGVWEVKTAKVAATGTGPMASQAEDVKRAEKGKVRKSLRNGQNLMLDKGEESPLEITFPEQAVRIGDQWRGETRLQSQASMLLYKVENFERLDGKVVVVISAQLEGEGQLQLSEPARFWIDVETGYPVKAKAALSIDPQPGFHVEIKVDLKSP